MGRDLVCIGCQGLVLSVSVFIRFFSFGSYVYAFLYDVFQGECMYVGMYVCIWIYECLHVILVCHMLMCDNTWWSQWSRGCT